MDDAQSNVTRLHALVADILRVPAGQIDDALDMDATSTWDSLSHMELIAAIEDGFGIELTSDDIVAMKSIAQIKATLAAHSVAI